MKHQYKLYGIIRNATLKVKCHDLLRLQYNTNRPSLYKGICIFRYIARRLFIVIKHNLEKMNTDNFIRCGNTSI